MATLTGHVSHYTEEMAAERAARRVKGVHAIAEGIEVRCLGETSDEEIARRAPNILKWYAMVPQDAVQVTVQKGRVILTGDVIWQYVSAYLLAASRCNRPGSQLNVRVQADFRFVPIQLAEGRPLAEQLGIDPDRPGSFAFLANGRAYVKSEAVLRIARELPRWQWTWIFQFIPRVIRDAIYDLVARNRYRWFGRRDACILPNSDRSWPS